MALIIGLFFPLGFPQMALNTSLLSKILKVRLFVIKLRQKSKKQINNYQTCTILLYNSNILPTVVPFIFLDIPNAFTISLIFIDYHLYSRIFLNFNL